MLFVAFLASCRSQSRARSSVRTHTHPAAHPSRASEREREQSNCTLPAADSQNPIPCDVMRECNKLPPIPISSRERRTLLTWIENNMATGILSSSSARFSFPSAVWSGSSVIAASFFFHRSFGSNSIVRGRLLSGGRPTQTASSSVCGASDAGPHRGLSRKGNSAECARRRDRERRMRGSRWPEQARANGQGKETNQIRIRNPSEQTNCVCTSVTQSRCNEMLPLNLIKTQTHWRSRAASSDSAASIGFIGACVCVSCIVLDQNMGVIFPLLNVHEKTHL